MVTLCTLSTRRWGLRTNPYSRTCPGGATTNGAAFQSARDGSVGRPPLWSGRPWGGDLASVSPGQHISRGGGVGRGCWPFLVLARSRFRWWRVLATHGRALTVVARSG